MLSQTAEYALRAAVWLAQHPDQELTTRQIAARTCIPLGYLSRVLHILGRAELVRAQRGPSGGFRLVKPAENIQALEIINAVDPIRRVRQCPLGSLGHGKDLCPLHRRIDEAAEAAETLFANTTLADLLEVEPDQSLCPAESQP